MKWVFLCYLILNPLFYWLEVDLRVIQEYFFQISSLLVIGCSFFFNHKEVKRDRMNIAIGALFLWIIVVFAINNMGLSIMANIFYGLAVYMVAVRTLKKKDIKFLFKGCIWVGIISGAHLICQYFGYDPRDWRLIGTKDGIPKCGLFGIRAIMGIYYACLIPMLLSISWTSNFKWVLREDNFIVKIRDIFTRKILGFFKVVSLNTLLVLGVILTVGAFFVPVAVSISSGAYLGAVLAVLVFYWYRRRILFWLLIIPIFAGGVLFLVKFDNPMGMQKSRLHMWSLVVQDFHKRPVGWGLDSFRSNPNNGSLRYFKFSFNDTTQRAIKEEEGFLIVNPPTEKEKEEITNYIKTHREGLSYLDFWGEPHNFYLSVLFEMGLPGLAGVFILLYFMWLRFRKSDYSVEAVACACVILVLLASGSTQFFHRVARTAHLIPFILACFYVATEVNFAEERI